MRKSAYLLVLVVMLGAILLLASNSCQEISEPQGYALAIGLNRVDPEHYGGWSGDLSGCEPDANDMKEIAAQQGFNVETLLTAQATRVAVLNKLQKFAEQLKGGDLLVLSYSGHGGQIPDHNGDEIDDGQDETWCLYDGQLLDDELYGAWTKFREGVHILAFSDSCHSGTVLKMIKSDWEDPSKIEKFNEDWKLLQVPQELNRTRIMSIIESDRELRSRIKNLVAKEPGEIEERPELYEEIKLFCARSIPPQVMVKTYQQNRQFYENIGKAAPKEDSPNIKASLILISACEDNQTAADLGFNGLFTWKIIQVWNKGEYQGNHRQFHEAIKEQVLHENSGQSPNFFLVGEPNEEFILQRPYTVGQ